MIDPVVAVLMEVVDHFNIAHREWDGLVTHGGWDSGNPWVEVAPAHGVSVATVVTAGSRLRVIEFFGVNRGPEDFHARFKDNLASVGFDLEEPGSIERLLSFLDAWVGRRK